MIQLLCSIATKTDAHPRLGMNPRPRVLTTRKVPFWVDGNPASRSGKRPAPVLRKSHCTNQTNHSQTEGLQQLLTGLRGSNIG